MNLARLRELCMSLPGVTEQIQWGTDLVFKVGGKMFCVSCTDLDPRHARFPGQGSTNGVSMMSGPPDRTEAAEYYFTYIDQVPAGDIRAILDAQGEETLTALEAISEERSLHRYAPDKWSIRQVVGHLSDTERLFVARAFWFARGFDSPLPSFDQNIAMAAAGADERSWRSHLDEFRAVRGATVSFFENLPADAWSRRGIASGNPFTVHALAYIAAGHVEHHMAILRSRYL